MIPTHIALRPSARLARRRPTGSDIPGHPEREARIRAWQEHYAKAGEVDLSKPDPYPAPPWPPNRPKVGRDCRPVVSSNGERFDNVKLAARAAELGAPAIYFSVRHAGKYRAAGRYWYYESTAPAEVLAKVKKGLAA